MLSFYVVTESSGEGYELLSVCRGLSGVTDSIDEYFGGDGGYNVLNRYDVGEYGIEYVLDVCWWDVDKENFTKVSVRRINVFDGLDFVMVDSSRLSLFLWLVLGFIFLIIFFNLMLCLM